MADVRILLISGSTRRGSGNTAALRTVQALAPDGIMAELYDGLAALPAFSPDEDERPPGPAADLRARIAAADALLFCTPEYAGTLPGSLKNLLDWTVGGGEIYGKPAAGSTWRWAAAARAPRSTSPWCSGTSARSPSTGRASACPSRGRRPARTGSSTTQRSERPSEPLSAPSPGQPPRPFGRLRRY